MNIDGIQNFQQWRTHARQLLQQHIPPTDVHWSGAQQAQLNFASPTVATASPSVDSDKRIQVPSHFIKLAKAAACYRDDSRWPLLYRLLWRLTHGEPHVLQLVTDPEVKRLRHMGQAVRRDVHKMHAFVRFKKQRVAGEDWYVAWFEPSHLIVPDSADFFVRRFNTMNWSILTPDACAHWNQHKLRITAGTDKPLETHQSDDMDDYWQQYYTHIFNPSRLKVQAMQSEMPKKYWHNLPEASLINELSQASGKRTQAMLAQPANDPNRLRNKSAKLRDQQDKLRQKHQT